MLEFIYQKLNQILAMLGISQADLDDIQVRLDRIEQQVKINTALLQDIRDTLNPGPAVTVKITAGPVTEQQ